MPLLRIHRRFSLPLFLVAANLWLALSLLLSPSLTFAASATPTVQAPDPEHETLVSADQIASDQNTNIVTATGHVEVARAGYILHADKVTYNEKTGVMHAEGHVAMLTPSGDVEFSDSEDVTGDMKQAFVENVGILFPDNSRMAARVGQRYDGRYMVADQDVYTSCNVCKANPDVPPFWQIQAKEAVHDNVEHEIYYHDATVNFVGVPLFYTPYMSTPDPTVDRRQGFLTPTPGYATNLGAFITVPYYFDIAPETDATLSPTFSQDVKAQMAGDIRHRFDNGFTEFTGSFTRADLLNDAGVDEGQQWRGHLFGTFLYDIDDTWRAGTNVQMVSDKSYLYLYHYSNPGQLTDRAYVEGFQQRDYAAVNSYYFEDLRPGTQPVQPLVLPSVNFNALGEPGQAFGGRWSLNGSSLITSRDNFNQGLNQQGPDTRRLSLDGGWERRLLSDTGIVTTISGLMRADGYWADNVISSSGTNSYDNVAFVRPFEQANAKMSYPMGRSGDGYQQLLEPIVAITAAPNVYTSAKQPIETGSDVQFDETSLFEPNRFTGYDLIEGGSRVTYGLRQALTGDEGQRFDVFGGQSYDFSHNSNFSDLSGLQDNISDYVGRIGFSPSDWMNFDYGFRLNHSNFSTERQDAMLTVGQPIFKPYIHYISGFINDPTTGLIDNDKEAIVGFASHFAKYYQMNLDHTQAFSPQPGARTTSVAFNYIDECYIFNVSLTNDDTNRADISSGVSVMFHMFLKNVGGIHTDTFSPHADTFPSEFRQTD